MLCSVSHVGSSLMQIASSYKSRVHVTVQIFFTFVLFNLFSLLINKSIKALPSLEFVAIP